LRQAAAVGADAETHTLQSDAGTVMGTVGYMAPEQVRGNPADARSDLFAFGAVLYEMISGKRAFHGESPADTMSAILNSEPPELTETNRSVPPALERIVRHCLEKSPQERFHSAHDVAFDLETLSSVSTGTAPAQVVANTPPRRAMAVGVALAALVAAALFLAGRYSRGPEQAPQFHHITYQRGGVLLARFMPDGQSVVYDAAWEGKPAHLFSTPSNVPEPRALDLENAHLFAVSPSGEAALGLGGRETNHLMVQGATLARSPLGGGAPRPMLNDVLAADWSPNGTLAVAHYVNGRLRVEYPIGKPLYETSGWVSDMRFSPSGDRIAFLDHPFWPDDRGWVAMVDTAGNYKKLTEEWEAADGLAWSADGKEVWFTATSAGSDRVLYAVTPSGKRRTVLSVPSSLRLYDIYHDGRVLLSTGHERVGMIALTGDKPQDLSWSGWTIAGEFSPDGKWLLFDEESEFAGPNYIVAMRTIDGSPPVKLGSGFAPQFSPDGKWVITGIPGRPSSLSLLPTGTGEPREIPVTGLDKLTSAQFVANDKIVLVGAEPGHGVRCYSRALDGGPMKAITREGTTVCIVSPDMRFVAGIGSSGPLVVEPINGGEARSLPGTDGMQPIRWLDNNSFLAYREGEMPAKIIQIDAASGQQRVVKELVPGDRAGVSQIQIAVATPDLRQFAYSYQQVLYELYVVEGLK
jgi:WD40 repeat protein